MPRYLSEAWFDAVRTAIDALRSPGEAGGDGRRAVTTQHVVTGTPDGDVTYHVRIDGGRTTIGTGACVDPTIVFTEDYATAAAINRGELSAQGAFMAGRIKVRGDLSQLSTAAGLLQRFDDVLAALRATTTY